MGQMKKVTSFQEGGGSASSQSAGTTQVEIMTTGELADCFKVSERTIYNWRKEGRISALPIPGIVRFDRSDVLKSLKKGGEL